MALERTWHKVEQLSDQIRAAIKDDPDRVSDLWAERQALLESVLNESSLSALSTKDLAWLRDAVEALQMNEQLMQKELNMEQRKVIDSLRKQNSNSRAVDAYIKQQ